MVSVFLSMCSSKKELGLGLYSNSLQRIINFVTDIRRHGHEEALQGLINFAVAYDSAQISFQQCKALTDFCLVEYDRKQGGFAVSQDVVEWARYFADTRESGRYAAIRGLLRRQYMIDPQRVRRLESMLMNVTDKPVMEVHDLLQMDLIQQCGDTHVLRQDVVTLFRDHFRCLPAGRVLLHEKPKSD